MHSCHHKCARIGKDERFGSSLLRFWCHVCAPEHLDHPFAFLMWGGVQESEGLAKARRVRAEYEKTERSSSITA